MAEVINLKEDELKLEFERCHRRVKDGEIKNLIMILDTGDETELLEVIYIGCTPGYYALGMLDAAKSLTSEEMYES